MQVFRLRIVHIIVFSMLVWGIGFYMFNKAVGASADISYEPPRLAPRRPIVVQTPEADDVVKSPLTIKGKARGPWYFEASFPVKLLDANNVVLAQGAAQAQGDWMTTSFVPFSITLTFPQPNTSTGTLVLQKDNPSGDPQNDDSISLPVSF